MKKTYQIGGSVIKIDCDAAFYESKETEPFLTESEKSDVTVTFSEAVCLPAPSGRMLSKSDAVTIYEKGGVIYRAYALPMMRETAAVTVKRDNGYFCQYHSLYQEHFSNSLSLFNAVGLETILAEKNEYILHCSLIELDGRAILFSGPSGIGKSTRAALWNRLTGSRLINGDKAILRKKGGVFYAAGLPVAGSSGVFRNEEYPIARIVFLGKSSKNSIMKLDGKTAFLQLFRNTIIHSWDKPFSVAVTVFLSELAALQVAYRSDCNLEDASVDIQKKGMGLL